MKVIIRNYSIEYGKKTAKFKKQAITELETQISIIEKAMDKNNHGIYRAKTEELKHSLAQLLYEKAKGAQIRSRANTLKKGKIYSLFLISDFF